MNYKNMTISERIKYLREKVFNVSMEQMAISGGKKSRSACNNWENGYNDPGGTVLMLWQKNKGINPDFVMYGKEPLFIESNQQEIKDTATPGDKATAEIIKNGKPVIGWEQTTDLPEGEYLFVKRYDVHLSAGNGHNIVYDEMEKATPQSFRVEWFNSRGFKPDDLICIYAKGDSMEPAIKDKASVTINTAKKTITDGEAYALRSGDDLFVKYLYKRPDGGIIIHSENDKKYPDIVVEAKDMEYIEIIGQVVNVASDW